MLENIDDSDNGMAELQRLNPDLFATVQKEQIATAHQRFIGLKKATLNNLGNKIDSTKSSISNATDEIPPELLKDFKKVIVMEEHVPNGGLKDKVLSLAFKNKVKSIEDSEL